MASLPGPTFWRTVFGYDDFDEFYDQVGKFIPSVVVGPGHLTQEAVAGIAYQNPASAFGNFAIGLAAARNAVPADEPALRRLQAGAAAAAVAGGLGGMAQLIIPGAFQVGIHAKAGSQDVFNVVGVLNGSGDANGAANAVLAAWKVAGGPLSRLANLYVMSEVVAVDIGSSNGAIVTKADTTTGTRTSVSFATAGACALVKWNGGTRSRSSRGRLYLGPITEADINTDGRTLTSAEQTNFNAAMNAFRNSLSSAGYPLVVLSRKMNQAYAVTSSTVETVIATQRRRIRS